MECLSYLWNRDAFPQENAAQLRDLMLDLTGHSVLAGRSKVILRKLFVAVRFTDLYLLHRANFTPSSHHSH